MKKLIIFISILITGLQINAQNIEFVNDTLFIKDTILNHNHLTNVKIYNGAILKFGDPTRKSILGQFYRFIKEAGTVIDLIPKEAAGAYKGTKYIVFEIEKKDNRFRVKGKQESDSNSKFAKGMDKFNKSMYTYIIPNIIEAIDQGEIVIQ